MCTVQTLGGLGEVELDDLGRAGANQEKGSDFRSTLKQPIDDTVEFGVAIGQSGEIPFLNDRGGETRLGKDHYPCRRLEQVRAGT